MDTDETRIKTEKNVVIGHSMGTLTTLDSHFPNCLANADPIRVSSVSIRG